MTASSAELANGVATNGAAAADSTKSSLKNIPWDPRIEKGSFNIPPAQFPSTTIPTSTDAQQVASDFLSTFSGRLAARDHAGLAALFTPKGYWRDHLFASWDLRTLKGPAKIADHLYANAGRFKTIAIDDSAAHRAPSISSLDVYGKSQCLSFFVTVTNDVGSGRGVVRLIPTESSNSNDTTWKIETLYTVLHELTGFEEPLRARRPRGGNHGDDRDTKNWLEQRLASQSFDGEEPAVLILGAGQGGLTSAARFKMLGVPALVVDQEDRVGDNWRRRYRQLVLHDPVWFDHMPYLEFPAHWPVFTPKDKLAEFFEAYVALLELNVWTRTRLVSSAWDDGQQRWTVTLERRSADGTTETRTFHPRHVIQATGHSGKKNMPAIKGMDTFKGRLCHSSEFTGAHADASENTGKRAVVVGSCNSGHDIAQDLWENGYNVTMVQRSSANVISNGAIIDIALGSLYSEQAQATLPVDDADLLLWSSPMEYSKAVQVQVTQLALERDRKLLEGLQKAGFNLDIGPDGAGMFFKYFQRGGGYYIDVGASQLIIDGKIKVKSGKDITEVTPDALVFEDGSRLQADEVIFATGYANMNSATRAIFGDAVADKTSDVWAFDEEGEFRTMWRRSGHPGFWFMGGNLAIARYYGKMLALQIKAQEEGLIKDVKA
ncbi:uncharacterized protein E0L32_010291 [Thyridium curvatum]|uniref:Flavin-containing monooxygenase n=1 Tax=Thyridium curvatum TaxID=1093900 RepID=A0A507AT53_9PEZI|nr:uncharacterized protein E0L32_010291 [Thyridium curvatum]TPX08091.1 hypothetical protein E0L32_010291 [Thyridium curvatum]